MDTFIDLSTTGLRHLKKIIFRRKIPEDMKTILLFEILLQVQLSRVIKTKFFPSLKCYKGKLSRKDNKTAPFYGSQVAYLTLQGKAFVHSTLCNKCEPTFTTAVNNIAAQTVGSLSFHNGCKGARPHRNVKH